MVCDVVAIPRNVALSTFGLPRIGLCCQPAQGEFNGVRGMSLKLRERVIEMLSSRPDERFKARDIASWICKHYRAEADEKLLVSKSLTRKTELLNQLVAELGATTPATSEERRVGTAGGRT